MIVTFEPARHEYRIDGRLVPSVTQVLEPLNDFGAVPAEVLDRAAEFGTHVHQAIALMLRNDLDWSSLDGDLEPYVRQAEKFIVESRLQVLAAERVVANARLGYAGTLDLLAYWKRNHCVIDWKTGALPRTVGPQTAAYQAAVGKLDPNPRKRYCVQLTRERYVVHALDDPADLSVFTSALNLYHWRRKHAA